MKEVWVRGPEEAEEVASWLWMFSILEWKNEMRLLHFTGVNEDEMLSGGLRSLFMMLFMCMI